MERRRGALKQGRVEDRERSGTSIFDGIYGGVSRASRSSDFTTLLNGRFINPDDAACRAWYRKACRRRTKVCRDEQQRRDQPGGKSFAQLRRVSHNLPRGGAGS